MFLRSLLLYFFQVVSKNTLQVVTQVIFLHDILHVCVCMCMDVYVCPCVWMRESMYVCVWMCESMYVCVCVCVCVSMCMDVCIHVCMCMYVCQSMCMDVCQSMCMDVCQSLTNFACNSQSLNYVLACTENRSDKEHNRTADIHINCLCV
jgi:hypothetical protein